VILWVKFLDLYVSAHSMTNYVQILHGDQQMSGKFCMVDHECWRAICLQ